MQERRGTAGSALRRALTFWRRSIQARVVLSTVLLSALVISIVGWVLLDRTQDGLLENRRDAVLSEVAGESADVELAIQSIAGTDNDTSSQLSKIFEPVNTRAEARGFSVVLAPAGGELTSAYQATGGLDPASVPARLIRSLGAPNAPTAWTYTTVRTDGATSGVTSGPGIAAGSRVRLTDGSWYVVYYVYSLQQEYETMQLVTQALITAALLLLVLVAGLTWVLTSQIVSPIRLARRVAERLAAGQLEERLRVRGEDDLARLAISFNQMASSLQRQIRQLEELSSVQRRFTSDVSHELRTPLTTVRMASDMLHDARGDFDPATARAAELLQTELDRFELLLADLLEISRFDAGAAVLDTDKIDLFDVAGRAVQATRLLADKRSVRVVLRAPEEPVVVEADARRVERVVRNLVSNAIDHAESGDVVVTVAGDESAGAVAVRDYGVGLAPGEAAMVFNRFWRADPARARTSGGTGLGLAISLEDAHLHGGWLQAWGRPGDGAQFRLTLPRTLGGSLRHSPLPLVPTDARETV